MQMHRLIEPAMRAIARRTARERQAEDSFRAQADADYSEPEAGFTRDVTKRSPGSRTLVASPNTTEKLMDFFRKRS